MKNTETAISTLAARTRELNAAQKENAELRSKLEAYNSVDLLALQEENARLKAENTEMLAFVEALGAAVQEAQSNG